MASCVALAAAGGYTPVAHAACALLRAPLLPSTQLIAGVVSKIFDAARGEFALANCDDPALKDIKPRRRSTDSVKSGERTLPLAPFTAERLPRACQRYCAVQPGGDVSLPHRCVLLACPKPPLPLSNPPTAPGTKLARSDARAWSRAAGSFHKFLRLRKSVSSLSVGARLFVSVQGKPEQQQVL